MYTFKSWSVIFLTVLVVNSVVDAFRMPSTYILVSSMFFSHVITTWIHRFYKKIPCFYSYCHCNLMTTATDLALFNVAPVIVKYISYIIFSITQIRQISYYKATGYFFCFFLINAFPNLSVEILIFDNFKW